MNVIKLQKSVNPPSFGLWPVTNLARKYPQFQQSDIFALQNAFRMLDVDDKGYVDENTAIKNVQTSEHQPYDVVRQALKEVELDSSRRVELEDYVDVCPEPARRRHPC
jgi:plastin-1